MHKTISQIQIVKIEDATASLALGGINVRPPVAMRCFRATIALNINPGAKPTAVGIATQPTNNFDQLLILSDLGTAQNLAVPTVNQNTSNIMEDDLYFYSVSAELNPTIFDGASVIIIWEGYKNE
jgi:hypothetical protein